MGDVKPEETYYSMLKALTANGKCNWGVMSKLALLRQRLGVSDDVHQAYLDELKHDQAVQALQRGEMPPSKRHKSGGGAAAAAAAAAGNSFPPQHAVGHGAAPARGSGKSLDRTKSRGRTSDPGTPQIQYGIAGRKTRFKSHDPFSLVGHRLVITQEDDSQVEVTVVEYNPTSKEHSVVMEWGTDQQSEPTPVPLWENPQSYEVSGEQQGYPFPAPPRPAPAAAAGGLGGRGSMLPPPAPVHERGGHHGAHARGGGPKQGKRPAAGAGAGRGAAAAGAGSRHMPPYEPGWLAGKLGQAGLPELGNLLMAISKKEKAIMAELEAAGFSDEPVSESITKRAELVQQLVGGAR